MKYQAKVPFTLTSKFYERLGYSLTNPPKDKKILVIRDVFTAMHAAITNSVVFVIDDEEVKRLFERNVVGNGQFGNDDSVIFIDTFEKKMKEAWLEGIDEVLIDMKFDCAIMNPPYNGVLHLQILEKVLNHCDKIVNISPCNIFTNPYAEIEKPGRDYKYRKLFSKCLCKLDIMLAAETNDMFNINFYNDLGIMVFDKCSTKTIDLGKFVSDDNLMIKLVKKISELNSLRSKFAKPCVNKYYVPVRRTNHSYLNWVERDFSKINAVECINFETIQQQENFIASFDTWLYKFLNKSDWPKRENSASVPFMQDYSQPWTNKRFCEFFNITGYIDDTTAEPNSEWEIILNTLKND